MPLYSSLFEPIRFNPVLILELGFAKGRGARCLLEYFPKGNVHSADFDLEASLHYADNMLPSYRARLTIHQFDQGRTDDYGRMLGAIDSGNNQANFDIIIDDCSHNPDHQMLSFVKLWPRTTPGGYYVIEDMHPYYQNGRHPTVEYFANKIHELNKLGQYKNDPTLDWQWVNFSPNRIILRKNNVY